MDEQPVQITRRASSIKPDANGHLLPNGFNLAALLEEELHEDDTVLAVTCRVCQNEIILADEEGFVVKCPKCNEATPIRNAPVGEKYVRCPCQCLLICQESCQKIACPRPNCKRVITINCGDFRRNQTRNASPGTVRVSCAHCDQEFLFNLIHNSLAKCPHCSKVSCVGPDFRRRQLLVFSCVVFFFALATGGTIGATWMVIKESPGIIALHIGLSVMTILALIRLVTICRWKVSRIQESI
ncbi:hypothetical protein RvY_06687-1 [Ramazzottius varieornatus]|uniref:Phosphatidylinositol-4,5-bisphosphate 4-phosphatase n=1 Tax=Ramazzottius varieornatus TaxID=947166 RepID=A0A1D1UZG7_RAMVA|nr:hypothetical protein RvY_06687-1 [Ramazzottius varieornatus]